MPKVIITIFTFYLCSFLAGAGDAVAEEIIRINGSGSALDMMQPLIKAYRKATPRVRIVMEKPLGSSGAIKALIAGALDIAVSSKILKPEEAAQGAKAQEYGKTPLIIVIEKSVGKTDITTRELEEIYSGKTRRWPNDEAIRVILRPLEDIDTKILRGLSPGMEKAVSMAQRQQGMIVAVTDPESLEAVSKTPGGIGASALTDVLAEAMPVNRLTLNGLRPTTKGLADGTYPLAKDIRFVTMDKTSAAAIKFLRFVYSPQGRSIAAKAGVLVSATNWKNE